jgi:CRP-like cAMP-binding protein
MEERRRTPAAAPSVGNQMLDLLEAAETPRSASSLEPVRLAADAVVAEEGDVASHAYFPLDCVISMQCGTRDGASVEFGLVGAEGVVGMEIFLERGRMPGRAVVIRPGGALRIPAQDLTNLFRRHDRFRAGLLSFYTAFNAQVIQRSICHRIHTIERQLCTWLLLLRERTFENTLELTHEVVAGLLGGRREGVTLAIKRLRDRGAIRSGRGNVTILDRTALEAQCCECYGAIRSEYAQLLPSSRHPADPVRPVLRYR